MQESGDPTAGFILLGIVLLTAYWSIRGIIQLFQRHNAILVILYLFFLFPIAYLHALILGIFGSSKAKREAAKIKAEAERQMEIERIKSESKS